MNLTFRVMPTYITKDMRDVGVPSEQGTVRTHILPSLAVLKGVHIMIRETLLMHFWRNRIHLIRLCKGHEHSHGGQR
jgi:hypothetical protein